MRSLGHSLARTYRATGLRAAARARTASRSMDASLMRNLVRLSR